VGAGQRDRALRAAWIEAAIAADRTEMIGLGAAAIPHAWLSLFDTNPAMLGVGSRYPHTVGPLAAAEVVARMAKIEEACRP
jgi:hypothetical protein